MRRYAFTACFLVCLLMLPELAEAQSSRSSSGTGGSSASSNRQSSSTARAGSGGTNRQTGQTGQQSAIDTAAGTSERIDRSISTGFVGTGDSGTGFIGNSQATNRQNGLQTPNFQQRQGAQGQGGKPSKDSPVRPVVRLGFDVSQLNFSASQDSPAITGRIDTKLQQRFTARDQFAGVNVSRISSDGVVLEGVVRSERDRKLAEAYLRLEPGVQTVENRLQVLGE